MSKYHTCQKMGENTLYSSFMMLTEHLYSVFAQYILSGRTRAPPESELIEMVPTFQFGAKTDRRALQSKFKSWAKRMKFDNGQLSLINSGKIIVPKEKCDDLIMHLHSKEHYSVEIIISLIQMNYSWTKKNFGMDRDVVVGSIFRNCMKEECHQKISLEVARFSSSGQVDTEIQGSSSAQCLTPYRRPIPLHINSIFPGNTFPIQIPFFIGMHNLQYPEKEMKESGPSENISLTMSEPKSSSLNEKGDLGGVGKEVELPSSDARSEKTLPVRFKKPRNVYEYDSLMEAVRLRPTDYPNILSSEKVQFLSKLGLAPKSICSSRTMKKLRQELRKKKLMTRNCIIYRERKVLRDRNKLNKCSQEKRKPCYLELFPRREQISKQSTKFSLERKIKDSFHLKFSRNLIRQKRGEPYPHNDTGTSQGSNPESVEVIDIITSEDEMVEATISSENAKENENVEIGADPTESSNHKSPSTMLNSLENTQDSMESKNVPKKEGHLLPFNETPQIESHRKGNAPAYHSKILNSQSILLPKMVNLSNSMDRIFTPNIPLPIKRLPAPKIVGSYAVHRNSQETLAGDFLSPRVNSAPVSILPKTPVFTQSQSSLTEVNRNISPHVVYSVHVPKSTNAKMFFVDKERKGAFIIVPQRERPILPRNSQESETIKRLSTEEQVNTNSLLTSSHILPQKPGSTGKKNS